MRTYGTGFAEYSKATLGEAGHAECLRMGGSYRRSLGGYYETERAALEDWAPRPAKTLDVEVRLSQAEQGVLRSA